jgi:hypothetical protein
VIAAERLARGGSPRPLLAAFAVLAAAACSQPTGTTQPDAALCAAPSPEPVCTVPTTEMTCWGPGSGCGPSLVPNSMCPAAPACAVQTPIPGVYWPGPRYDLACGRAFGTPWCFYLCNAEPHCLCHSGIDLDLHPGDPVHSIADGRVVIANLDPTGVGMALGIQHDIPGIGRVTAIYMHLDPATVSRHEGDTVCAGEQLGGVFQWTCDAQMRLQVRTHFHFALYRGDATSADIPLLPSLEPDSGCGEGRPQFPDRFIDPMCVLQNAPLPPMNCL